MRADVSPPPSSRDDLVELTPHEIVRRYPESLALFRGHGVDLRERGARPLEEVVRELGDEPGKLLVQEIGRALEWRSPSAP